MSHVDQELTSFSRATSADRVEGLIERVTYFNEDSGFSVLRVKASGYRDLVTVVGALPSASPGEWFSAEGSWFRDKEYGLQLKAQGRNILPFR
jgi:exodeoxyribonuclease V alpha subunit